MPSEQEFKEFCKREDPIYRKGKNNKYQVGLRDGTDEKSILLNVDLSSKTLGIIGKEQEQKFLMKEMNQALTEAGGYHLMVLT